MFIETYQPMDNIEKFDVADGAHVVQIVNAQRTWTKDKTKQMVLVDLRVEGQRNQINYQFRIVEGESFGMIMTNFFKMFGIQLGNFSFMTWLNMRAMGNFEHKRRTYNGREIESCELTSFAPIAQQPPMYGA